MAHRAGVRIAVVDVLARAMRPAIEAMAPLFGNRRVTSIVLVALMALSAVVALSGHPSAPAQPATTGFLAPTGASGAADAAGLGSLLGGSGGPDVVDLVGKGVLVLVLLYITLRVLRRLQGGTATAGSQISVIESRGLAAKASLHLVAIGDRRLVIGLTQAGMVALTEFDAAEIAPSEETPR